jgi:hypothetical protein
MPHGKHGADRSARENVDAAAHGKPQQRGFRDDMDVESTKGTMARGRGPGRSKVKRHR